MSCTPWWARARRRLAGRGQYSKAGPLPRRNSVHRATTPAEFRKSIEKDRSLERRFQASRFPADRNRRRQNSVRHQGPLRKISRRAYTDDAIETAVYTSSRYIPTLPADKAIDLIDEAGPRQAAPDHSPAELADIQKRIKFIVHRMETPCNHEFEKAASIRRGTQGAENMRQLREKYNLDDSSTGCVTKDDIEDVVARWTGVP